MKRYIKLFEDFGSRPRQASRLSYEEKLNMLDLFDRVIYMELDKETRDSFLARFVDPDTGAPDDDSVQDAIGYMINRGDFDHVASEEDAMAEIRFINQRLY
jgi:hypothetical protein